MFICSSLKFNCLGEANSLTVSLFFFFFFFFLNCYAVHDVCFKGFRRYVSVSSVPRWARSRCHVLTAPTWHSCPTGIEDGPASFYEKKKHAFVFLTSQCLLDSRRQFERSAPIMGIIVDHFVDPPCSSQRPVNFGQPCNYK